MTLLPREIGVVRETGLSRDKFTTGNIHEYVGKKTEGYLNRGTQLNCKMESKVKIGKKCCVPSLNYQHTS